MKKLKKLSLKKEVIVNLNDSEMDQLQGGSSPACATVAISIASAHLTYDVGKDQSFWTCPTPPPEQQTSNYWMWIGNEHCCVLDDVYVYGLYPNG